MTPKEVDIRSMTRWLGPQGARAGLLESKIWTVELLKETAMSLGIKFTDKITRKELVEEIVKIANKRIEKPLDELYTMDSDQLKDYFEIIGAETEELLELLKEMNLSPQRREGRKNLIEFAAREISETGRFMRIASKR